MHVRPTAIGPMRRLPRILALLVLALMLAGSAAAQTWTSTSAPPHAITTNSATLLVDGRVLIVGAGGGPLLFEPRNGTWQETVDAPADLMRVFPRAVGLRDGRVLVFSGSAPDALPGQPPLATAYLFDPRTNGWTPAASTTGPRFMPGAVRLADGQVLAAGGYSVVQFGSGFPNALASAERFDPATNSWTPVSPMAHARSQASLALLPDGRAAITGGNGTADLPLEIFDPVSGTFSTHATPPTRRGATGTLLMSGGELLVAGINGAGGDSVFESYRPGDDTWAPVAPPSVGLNTPGMALLPDGRILVLGINDTTAQIYDATSNTWSAGGTASEARELASPTMTLLVDGRVLVTGGNLSGQTPEIFDGRQFAVAASTATGLGTRYDAASAILADGRVLVVGGIDNSLGSTVALDTGGLYDPATDTWTPTPRTARPWPFRPDAVTLLDGRVMLLGGHAETEIYDPASNTWSPGATFNLKRGRMGVATLSNGWVIAAGGLVNQSLTETVEIYLPEANRWAPVASMPEARYRLGAVRLRDDRVLVAGGIDNLAGGVPRAEAWVYDYRTDTWTATAPLPTPTSDTKLRLLPDGRVLLVGAVGDPQIWNPATGAWTAAPIPAGTAADAALISLSTGEVAAIGGVGSDRVSLFDPTTSTWRLAGALGLIRSDSEAAALSDGRLLVVGGRASNELALESTQLVTLSHGRDPLRIPTLTNVYPIGGTGALMLVSDLPHRAEGLGFETNHLASGGTTSSSATNQPFIRYRNLTVGEWGFLPATSWTDPGIELHVPTGLPTGPGTVEVRVNGIASNVLFPLISGSGSWVEEVNVTVPYSPAAQSVTLPLTIGATRLPLGGGIGMFLIDATTNPYLLVPVARTGIVGPDGRASATIVLPAGTPPDSYPLTAVYAGDSIHVSESSVGRLTVTPAATHLTLAPAAPTVVRGASLRIEAAVTPVDASGTVAISSGGASCSAAAPSGGCDLTFSQVGAATVSGAFTSTSGLYAGSTNTTTVNVTCPAITLAPTVLAPGRVNEAYSAVISANGGLAPYTFTVTGALPPGLTLTGDTLSGTPTSTFDGTITLIATENGAACRGEQAFTLTIESPAPTSREYTLAEGVTNSFFASFILIANPNAAPAPIAITYAGVGGVTASDTRTLPPFSRVTIPTGDGSAAQPVGTTFTTRVVSSSGLPLLVERATYFDAAMHAGDLSSASEGGASTTWHFAEGANGYFHTYLALGNLHADQPAVVTVRYLPEGGTAFEREYTVAAHSRTTIDTFAEPELASTAFAMSVRASLPIVADRVQYFGAPFIGAHSDSGTRELSRDWYFAEGASGPVFDTYLLLAHPTPGSPAQATVTFHTDAGDRIERTYPVPPDGRVSISVDGEDPRLAMGSFWMEVHADQPIVAERAMYVVRDGAWTDATATTGARAPATRWGLAEGAVGMTLGYAPYLLIANPSAQPAEIAVRYLRASGEAPAPHTYTLAAGARMTLDIRAEEPSLIDAEFGILVTSTTDTPIVVERSQYWTLGAAGFVGAMSTMGTPLPVAPPDVP